MSLCVSAQLRGNQQQYLFVTELATAEDPGNPAVPGKPPCSKTATLSHVIPGPRGPTRARAARLATAGGCPELGSASVEVA